VFSTTNVFLGCRKRDRQPKKKEAKKGTDKKGLMSNKLMSLYIMYTVDGGCRLEVRNNKRATARVPDFISSFLLDGTCEGPM